MRPLEGVMLLVCVCLLLCVSLVESRDHQFVPSFCRQFIDRTQAVKSTDVTVDDDNGDDDELEEINEGDKNDAIKDAVEEIAMLNMIIDFMGFNSSDELSAELREIVTQDMSVDSESTTGVQRAGPDGCVRKEYRMLTNDERRAFHAALNAMRRSRVRDSRGNMVTEYQLINSLHQFREAPGAHDGPAFLVWHAEYIFRFEVMLEEHCPECCLPYFDSRLERFLPNARDSSLWAADLMGNNNGRVRSGPAANWRPYQAGCRRRASTLTRGMLTNAASMFFSPGDVTFVTSRRRYQDLCIPYNSRFERRHAAVHSAIGGRRGHIGSLACATEDPFFFLLHAGVDYYFYRFLQNNRARGVTYPRTTWRNHGPRDAMRPFENMVNEDGLTRTYTPYELSPFDRRCTSDDDCRPGDGSGSLWCNAARRRCAAMVQPSGDCTGMTDNACRCPAGTRPRCGGSRRRRRCSCQA